MELLKQHTFNAFHIDIVVQENLFPFKQLTSGFVFGNFKALME